MTMPEALFHRVNLDLCYPPWLEAQLDIIAECRDRYGVLYLCTEILRPLANSKLGKYSAHVYALAGDYVRLLGEDPYTSKKEDFSWKDEDYETLGIVTERHGQVWGGHFQHAPPDRDHINLQGFTSKEDLEPLAQMIQGADESVDDWLTRIWAEVDKRRGGNT